MAHSLKRTSPKGGPFIGACINCGKTDIPLSRMHEECANYTNRTDDESLMHALKGGH